MKNFFDGIDTPSGHILICAVLGLFGVYLLLRGHEMAAEPLISLLGVITYAMNSKNKNP